MCSTALRSITSPDSATPHLFGIFSSWQVRNHPPGRVGAVSEFVVTELKNDLLRFHNQTRQ